jgi:hypothetical protein
MSHGVMCMLKVLYTECHQGSWGYGVMSHGVMCIDSFEIPSHQVPTRVTGWVLHVTRCHVHDERPIYRMPSRVTGYMVGCGMCPCDSEKFLYSECRVRSQGVWTTVSTIQSKLQLWDLNHGVPPRDHMVYQFLPVMR